MVRLTVIAVFFLCLTNCSNPGNKTIAIDKPTSSPVPEKDLVKLPACVFDNPDTSLSNIKLRDSESATSVLKVKKLNGDTTYYFQSKDKKQILGVTVHPGDGYSLVSIFQVKYAKDSKARATPTAIQGFTTEKDIKLGLSRDEIVTRLGNCYKTNDSTKNFITVNYRIESPNDSKTKLLEHQNMPNYYATYKFIHDKLVEYEFGFEYP